MYKRVILVFLFTAWICLLVYGNLAKAETPGISPDKILLGTSLPLSGHAAYLGQEVLKGMQAYFNFINQQGGVCGRKIVLKAYDDAYNPPLTIGNVKNLVEKDRVFALLSLVGTPTTLTVVEFCKKKHIPLLFPITGAIELRRPVRRYVFNLRPSYWDESRLAVDFLIKKLHKKRFAILYQHDAYGLNGLEGIKRRLLHYDLDLVGKAYFFRGAHNLDKQLNKLLKTNPEVIAIIGTAEIYAKFMQDLWLREKAKNIIFLGISFTGAYTLAQEIKNLPYDVYITQVLPSFNEDLPAAKEYRKLFQRYFPQQSYSSLSFEGFLNAKLFTVALQKLGPHPSRQKLIVTLERFRNLDLGLAEKISFSANDHQGLKKVYLIHIKNDQLFCLSPEI